MGGFGGAGAGKDNALAFDLNTCVRRTRSWLYADVWWMRLKHDFWCIYRKSNPVTLFNCILLDKWSLDSADDLVRKSYDARVSECYQRRMSALNNVRSLSLVFVLFWLVRMVC